MRIMHGMDETLRQWGENIRLRREALQLNQKQLAGQFTPPLAQSTVARWEKGLMEPRRDHKRRLAEILSTDVRMLFPMHRGVA